MLIKLLKLIRETNGAAMTEGLVMLPLLALLWGGLLYAHRNYEQSLSSSAEARRCAWTYANDGCKAPPPGCSTLLDPNALPVPSSVDPAGAFAAVSSASAVPRMVREWFNWNKLFGYQGKAVATRQLTRPTSLGGDRTSINRHTTIMCNTEKQETGELIMRMFLDNATSESLPYVAP